MENLQKKIEHAVNLYRSKKLLEAETYTRELVDTYPNSPILYNILGLVLFEQKKTSESIEAYKKGIKIKPDYAMIYNNLGSVYKSMSNFDEAETYYKKSIDLDKKIAEPLNNLGNLNLSLNKHEDAISYFKKAISINPNYFVYHYNLGIVYKSIGEFDSAKDCLTKSIDLNLNFFPGHRALSQIIKYDIKNKHFHLLKKIYKDSSIKNFKKTELSFALAKAHDDIKDYKNAFNYYNIANELRRKEIHYSFKNSENEFQTIKNIFSKELFEKFQTNKNLDSTAIFIVGMPRSGTTLIEQIISTHPDVFGGDELEFLNRLVAKYFNNSLNELNLKEINNKTESILINIANEYVQNLKKISKNSTRVTDKLPINFKWIGLIKLILPKSIIINCVRNSKDNCLSIYKNYFVNTKLNFAYNLDEIVDFYNLYIDLMKHWREILPNFVFDIEYEKLIKNPETEIKHILNKCNLKWNKECLKFYNNKRPIKTASDTQARKKIYKTSLNSWKNYEAFVSKHFSKLST